jgi:outer membrane protein assembly factor BamB
MIHFFVLVAAAATAADWPEWRGQGRLGVFPEEGILDAFPEAGLRIRWRAPVRSGFAGPAVAAGRVFLTDFQPAEGNRGIERAIALEEKTGKVLWAREWQVAYIGLARTYATGPRATPTVDGNRVYVLGAMGTLLCLDVRTGAIYWQRDYVRDFGTQVPVWGMTGAPLVDGRKLIILAGSQKGKVMALDKTTGEPLWSAIPPDSEPGYSPPFLIQAGGRKQLIQWHPAGLASLDPETGQVFWEQPFKLNVGLAVGTPVHDGARLLVSAFYNGPMMMRLGADQPKASMAWKGQSDSEVKTDGLHSLISTPVIDGDYVYGVCSYGLLRCLNANTGERVWETLAATGENARWSTAHIVRHKDRYFVNNDRGDLILAKLSPKGYEELSRTTLIKPTSRPGNRREREFVNWSHPAYANGHIFARNDEEIICASLEKR